MKRKPSCYNKEIPQQTGKLKWDIHKINDGKLSLVIVEENFAMLYSTDLVHI